MSVKSLLRNRLDFEQALQRQIPFPPGHSQLWGNTLDFCHSHQLSNGVTAPEAQGVYSHFWSAELFLVEEISLFSSSFDSLYPQRH